jgi:hypothetical protein
MLAVGTVHAQTLLVVAAFASLTAVVALSASRDGAVRLLCSTPALVFWLLAAYTVLQAAPIPVAWLTRIAPANADVWKRCLMPFGEAGPTRASLSLDPGASWLESVKWFTYGATFVSASVVASRRGATWGVALVFLSAIVAALTTIGHGLANASKVFGLYQPHFAVAPWHLGPLLNGNNLAGYINLGALCGLGLVLATRPIAPRWLLLSGVAMLVGVDVTSASRGGFLALPVGIALLGLLLARRGRNRAAVVPARVVAALLSTAVVAGVVLALLGATSETWRELYDKNLGKLAMVTWVKPLIAQHPWFGIGRGAFESVFPAYRMAPGNVVYTHVENFVAQWAVEWGLPIAILAVTVLGATVMRPSRLAVSRSSIRAGAWVGVIVLLIQNVVDLALEVPSVCLAVAVALGSLWGSARRHGRSGRPSRTPPIGAVPVLGFAAAGLTLLAIGGVRALPDLGEDRDAISRALDAGVADAPAIRDRLRAAMLRHPADPWFPLIGAYVVHASREGNPLPWLERSLERGSSNGRAHLLLAEVIASRSRSQALMEARLAVRDDPELAIAAAGLALRLSKDPEELERAAPFDAAGAAMLEAEALGLGGADDREVRHRLLQASLARDPSRTGAHEALGWDLVTLLSSDPPATECADERRAACERELEDQAQAVERLDPETSRAARIRAGALAAEGKSAIAERMLAERCLTASDRVPCLLARARAAADARPPSRLATAVKELMAAGCGSAKNCAEVATWVGDLLASHGDWAGAATYYARATREQADETRWLKLADAAARVGTPAQAADALEKVARLRGGGDDALRKRIAEYRAAAVGKLVEGR